MVEIVKYIEGIPLLEMFENSELSKELINLICYEFVEQMKHDETELNEVNFTEFMYHKIDLQHMNILFFKHREIFNIEDAENVDE